MTNEEIKKSLQTCADAFPCEGCPYDDNFGKCVVKLKEDARSLIIEQEKEIERLKAENKQLKTECALLDEELRIARQDTINVLNELKSKCHNYYPSIDHYCCSVKAVNLSDINELIKELIKNAEDKS